VSRAVGFWCQNKSDLSRFPHPDELVEPDWAGADTERIITYLRSGRVYCSCCGYSFCRFTCGIDDSSMGCCELGDGLWHWPEGLAHYVECHSVRLPDDFIGTMLSNRWQMPPEETLPSRAKRHMEGIDYAFWVEWARGRVDRLRRDEAQTVARLQEIKLQKEIERQRGRICHYCRGSSDCYCKRKGGGDSDQCARCNGSGKCHACKGTGRLAW
jgi:hypothetical protein